MFVAMCGNVGDNVWQCGWRRVATSVAMVGNVGGSLWQWVAVVEEPSGNEDQEEYCKGGWKIAPGGGRGGVRWSPPNPGEGGFLKGEGASVKGLKK